jgi:tetratricopeptide (TPR) repeat protein
MLRSAALFAILYQFRLIAGDLADTAVFAAALLAGFAAAFFLSALQINGKRAKAPAALAAIALIPWVTRALIAMPRLFFPGRADSLAVVLDSLLLNIDRNNVVSLVPFYWTAVTEWFSIRSRRFLRGAVVADAVLLLLVFSIARTSNISLYRWPIVMIVLFAGIVFVQALALLFSPPPEIRLRKSEAIPAALALLALIIFGGFLFLKPSQERAVEKGGGLLEPKLFSFDFSQFLRLDSEISMNDDLILIVKKDSNDDHILLRRSVLSGYSKKQGFYRIEELDERAHPQRLPDRPTTFDPAQFKSAQRVKQEYFFVNFDAAAFVGMKEPLTITPYESWDASSFSSAYAVESLTSVAAFTELSRSVPGAALPVMEGLSETEYKIYTGYGGDERIRSYAEEITRNLDRYSDKVRMIHNWLKYGEYRYSLKPGIAPDGDQLSWFLFQSKKGYCSYYAFSMALLLRSLGIPARVAAGFFIDPEANTFDYYPVRSDMAHAWVEVFFPGYGWIEFDPTTENLAEGEEFRFSAGVDPNLFERLMREILENRSRLRVRQGRDAAAALSDSGSLAQRAAALLKKAAPSLLPLLLTFICIFIRCGCLFAFYAHRGRRKRALYLWKHARRRLRLAGMGRPSTLPEPEWARQIDLHIEGVYAMYQGAAAARYAPEYSKDDLAMLQKAYRGFSAAYQKNVPLRRRLLAWLLPPLAFALGPAKPSAQNSSRTDKGSSKGGKGFAPLVLLLVLFVQADTAAQDAGEGFFSMADELYNSALDARHAEFWERAIELFKEGGVQYPGDIRFPWELGNLYYSRSLYGLAWDEYRKAEIINPFNTNILLRLAHTAGYLNRDQTSVEYLERLLTIDPDNKEAIGNLGWMYYKVHRLKDGERLLNEAIERFGDDADLAMTLGTVYSDMYHYDEGKYWYKKAIAQGEALRDRVFTAVAHYNLSILESRFYRFDLSMDEANASLESQNRASGRLARGEIYLRQLALEKAQTDYETAYEIDTSPLAKINLAQIYQVSGKLEEARLYAEDCLKAGDLSWMMNYGIDPDRYKRDIHEILYKTYLGLAKTERFMPWGRFGEKIRSLFRVISFRFKSTVHRKLYQKYSLVAGDAYGAGGFGQDENPPLDSFIQYYNAFEAYPRRALTYLTVARNFETAIIPAAVPTYDLEEGLLLKNNGLVSQSLAWLDPVWEREMVSQCYRNFALRGFGDTAGERSAMRREAAGELFALNRGALRQAGIGLPVELQVTFNGEAVHSSLEPLKNSGGSGDFTAVNHVFDTANNENKLFLKREKTLIGALKKTGFKQTTGARFRLSIQISGSAAAGYSVLCELADTTGGENMLRRTLALRSLSRLDIYDFSRTLGRWVFRIPS